LSRTLRRISVLLGVGVMALTLGTATGYAHSFVKSTKPEAGSHVSKAPEAIFIQFDEPVELAFGGIEVLDRSGDQAHVGEAEYASQDRSAIRIGLASALGNGRYTVEWSVVAQDGHRREGRFSFRLDQPTPPSPAATPEATTTPPATPVSPGMGGPPAAGEEPDVEGAGSLPRVLFGITRWVLFVSLFLLVGLGSFGLALWPLSATPTRPPQVDQSFSARWGRIMVGSWLAALGASAVSLVLEGALAAEVPLGEAASGQILGPLLGTRFGVVTAARLGLLVVLGALLLGMRTGRARRVFAPAEARPSVGAAAAPAPLPWGSLSVGALLAIAVLTSVSLAGHAGTSSPMLLGMSTDVAHLAAGALWTGGLVALVGVAMPATRDRADGERVGILAPVVSRFSTMAMVCVAVIVATGVVRGWMEIRTIPGLTGRAYGISLLVKVAVVIPLIALGAINNRWTKPRIRRAAADATSTGLGSRALRTLRRLVLSEVLLAAVVIAVTAILVDLPPPAGGMEPGH
jgi:copper transport protein